MKIELEIASKYADLIKSLHPEAVAKKDIAHPSSMNHLLWLCDKVKLGNAHSLTNHRMVGFIQGVLSTLGIIDLEEEIRSIEALELNSKYKNTENNLLHQYVNSYDIHIEAKH